MTVAQLTERDQGVRRNDALSQRVEALRERVVGTARARGTFGVDGLVFDDGARLLLHGQVNHSTVPHLEAVLDGVVALRPSRLTVDPSETTGVSLDALVAIVRRQHEVEHFVIRLATSATSAILGLLRSSSAAAGQAESDVACGRGSHLVTNAFATSGAADPNAAADKLASDRARPRSPGALSHVSSIETC
jgi:hypothetical protein